MFKLLHYSDTHLGLKQYGMYERLFDVADSLSEVLRIAIEQNVDAVVDTGDTFNSAEPDPYSVRKFRQFVDRLTKLGIKFIGITGNHNYHEVGQAVKEGTWMDAVSDNVIRPSDPSVPIQIFSRDGRSSISVVGFDWMPSDKITQAVSQIPEVVDALFMHQSCEGFMPVIARAEMSLAQVDGKARYVGVGDIHVTKKQITESGTVVGSAGSTEMMKKDEPSQKYAILVTFGDKKSEPLWEPIEINTRRVIIHPCIRTEDGVESLRKMVDGAIAASPTKMPMVVVNHLRSMTKNIEALKRSFVDKGLNLFRFTAEPDVIEEEEITEERVANSTSMIEIIEELLATNEAAKKLSMDLWSNPEMAQQTIESFKQGVLDKHLCA
jgi:DNA repair exonuclease SbcCD nuclease subunit